ncbi:MAG: hypothetical protein ACK42L_11235, partial [Thermoanaerobaculum sp.]
MGRLFSLLALVLAMAIGLWIFSQKASKDVQRVTSFQLEGEKSAQPASVDWREAQDYHTRLEALLAESEPAPQELSAIAQKAAQWVAGSRPGSPEYRLAVALRAACLALSQAGPAPGDPQRQKARSELAIARSVLAGESPGSVTHGL